MKLFTGLAALVTGLPGLPADHHIWLPEPVARALQPDAGDFAALLAAQTRFLVLPPGPASRLGYSPWLRVDTLARICQPFAGQPAPDAAALQAALSAHLRPAPRLRPSGKLPPLAWPSARSDAARLRWWQRCAQAWLKDAGPGTHGPASRAALDDCEQRLGCPLPPLLRAWHQHIGMCHLAEQLMPPAQIKPLAQAYPSLPEVFEDQPNASAALALAGQLVAFGDYLGNGNLWCFHRQSDQLWYFDHDCAPHLVPMPCQVADYLDALALLSLAELHGQPEQGQRLLRQRLGDAAVDKWMY